MHARWAGTAYPRIRVYLDAPGGNTLQLLPVPGIAVLQPDAADPTRLVEVIVVYAFGPPDMPAPPKAAVRVEPDDSRISVKVRVYKDMFGTTRFTPTYPLMQTSN